MLLISSLKSIVPSSCIPRPHPLIKTHAYGILRIDLPIKRSLEVSMRTQTLFDKTASASLRPQLQGFEPLDVFAVEEHVADRDELLVDFVGMAGEYYALGDDAVG